MTEVNMIWKEIMRGAEDLGKHYIQEFKRKYKLAPFEVIPEDEKEILTSLYKQHGLETGKKLITTFINMEDEWLTKMGHSLNQLKKNLVRVIETEGARSPRRHSGHLMRILWSCDVCYKHSYIERPLAYNWDQRTLCHACEEAERSGLTQSLPPIPQPKALSLPKNSCNADLTQIGDILSEQGYAGDERSSGLPQTWNNSPPGVEKGESETVPSTGLV